MYNILKTLDKYTIRSSQGAFEKLPQSTTLEHLTNYYIDIYRIWLTKCDSKNCDAVTIIPYDPDGNIQDSRFTFEFFNYQDGKIYIFNIFYVPQKSNFWGKTTQEGYWCIEIKDKRLPNAVLDSREYQSSESQDVELILEKENGIFRKKILSLIKNYRYNRITIGDKNMTFDFDNSGGE